MRIKNLGQLPGEIDPSEFESQEDFDEWRERWLGITRRCAIYTRVGHYNPFDPEIPTGEVEVCLTSRQARTLFGDKIARTGKARRLGCGTFACAWDRGRGKAVKITADPDDVTALLEAQGLPHIVRIDNAYRVKGSGSDRVGAPVELYGLVGEKLKPLDQQRTEWFMEFPERSFARFFEKHYGYRHLTPGEGDEEYRIEPEMKKATQEAVCYQDEADCDQFIGEVVDTLEALGQRGINWTDLHEGNVGMTGSGVWKILDLGISGEQAQPTEKQAPSLRGSRRAANLPLLGVALATLIGLGITVFKGV